MNFNLLEDFLKVNNINLAYKSHIISIITSIIIQNMKESKDNGVNTSTFDVGIGNLCIINEQDEVRIKFIPNDFLLSKIKNPSTTLSELLEQKINEKMLDTYKDFM